MATAMSAGVAILGMRLARVRVWMQPVGADTSFER
jgi:hypothetical protein